MSSIIVQSATKLNRICCIIPRLPSTVNYCQYSNVSNKFNPTNCQLLLSKNFLYSSKRRKHTASKDSQHHKITSIYHKYIPIMDAPDGVFCGSVDRFNGITVESELEYAKGNDTNSFECKLLKSLNHWKESKRRCIWFKVKTEHADWIPHLSKLGFDFHHAKNGFVVMYLWLPTEEYANIPTYAHTMLGVGGLVVNENNEILVVSDRFAFIPNSWKLPGGYVEPKEDLVDAAIREVREETGINCNFKTVVSIRHSHGGNFGCSDIYVVVGLTPTNLDLQRDEREIAKLRWMPVDEYLVHPQVHETNRHFLRTFLDYNKRGIRFTWETTTHQVLKIKYSLYYMKPIEEPEDAKAHI